MKCCGVDISGSDLILVTVDRSTDGVMTIAHEACGRISLNDSADQASVRAFSNAIATFAKNHNISTFAIRGRAGKGRFAGGSTSFKIEGLLQIIEGCTATIIQPQSIAARLRKTPFSIPDGTHIYQHDAFLVACCLISE